jgi:hypothetical protein
MDHNKTTRAGAAHHVGRAAGLVALLCVTSLAHADAWFDAGDSALRHDLQYLVDSGVIDMPVTAWPIPSADIAWALENVKKNGAHSPGQLAAIRRMKGRLSEFTRDSTHLSSHLYGAGNPQVLRAFENTPREEAEIGGSVGASGKRFSGRLSVAYVTDPDDDKSVRPDGTYGSARLGNWLLTAGALDRWWGPGWDGSLILSNNARPVPAIALDRESSQAFESKWLNWIGPWRLTTFMGQMEEEREDLDHPLLFGMRLTFRPFGNIQFGSVRPFRGIEFALERTAQWCGEGLPCDWDAFWNVLTGNDNAGETVDPEDEPGNQLAGWSLRWASPFKGFPVAFYRQKTGETIDLDSPLPRRTLDLLGVEVWGSTQSGWSWRAHAEYADSACSEPAGETEPAFDCAYNHSLFNVEGYRYRGHPVGHSMDGDGLSYTLGLQLLAPRQWSGSLLIRRADLNRGGAEPDARNTVAQEAVDLWNVEVGVALPLEHADVRLGLGYDDTTAVATDEQDQVVRGFIDVRYRF